MTLSLSVSANVASIHSRKAIPCHCNYRELKDSTIDTQPVEINVYKLIISGKEEKIKKYFREATAEELLKTDSGAIAKAFKRLNTNDKVSRTIWILEETKGRNIEIRDFIYNELLKVDYGKPSFFLNHMINNYFTNYNETDTLLSGKVRKLHGKMNR